ncbi:rev protein [Simian immunodeficiency virus]|uniref:Rev protein n=1 Tax=Simian immunodeficiency virus TaxID=11723 RepID=Q90Q86_SIV|nr:rev protein [Simian immunodeficiency virus]
MLLQEMLLSLPVLLLAESFRDTLSCLQNQENSEETSGKNITAGLSPSSLCLKGRLSPTSQPQTARRRKRRRAQLRRTEHQVRELQERIWQTLEARANKELVEGVNNLHLAEESAGSN